MSITMIIIALCGGLIVGFILGWLRGQHWVNKAFEYHNREMEQNEEIIKDMQQEMRRRSQQFVDRLRERGSK